MCQADTVGITLQSACLDLTSGQPLDPRLLQFLATGTSAADEASAAMIAETVGYFETQGLTPTPPSSIESSLESVRYVQTTLSRSEKLVRGSTVSCKELLAKAISERALAFDFDVLKAKGPSPKEARERYYTTHPDARQTFQNGMVVLELTDHYLDDWDNWPFIIQRAEIKASIVAAVSEASNPNNQTVVKTLLDLAHHLETIGHSEMERLLEK